MSTEANRLEAAIAALEAQRATLGDAVVDALLAPARTRLATLTSATVSPDTSRVRRQVSVLFVDVVGFTRLSQRLDPEEIGAVMDDALAREAAAIEAHGGRVLHSAGDSLLAVFGFDATREDDAERAVHAGLALLALGRAL